MKIITILLISIMTFTTMANEVSNGQFCKTFGPTILAEQVKLVDTPELQSLLSEINQNFNYICNSTSLSQIKNSAIKEQKLDIITRAVEQNAGASYFEAGMLTMFLKGVATNKISIEELEEIFE